MKIALYFLCLFSAFPLFAKEITTVQSESAHYDGKEITLTGQVVVENSMGKLFSETAVLKRTEQGKSKIDFSKVELCRHVTAHLFNGSLLRCDIVHLDYDSLTGVFYGSPQEQVYYQDDMGEIYADRVTVTYAFIDGEYKPAKITLRDHVQLINRSSLSKIKDKVTLQYALADYVEVFPNEETMLLKAYEGKRVLFFDKIKDMQLSAKLIKGQRTPSGNQSIQGQGDVRFTFGQEEIDKLKKHFNID